MSNPFLNKRNYGKNVLQNPVYCLGCNCKYNEKLNDIDSNEMENYCRYLGFCNEACWDKVPDDLKNNLTSYTYTNGAKVKSNHKFFMENIRYI